LPRRSERRLQKSPPLSQAVREKICKSIFPQKAEFPQLPSEPTFRCAAHASRSMSSLLQSTAATNLQTTKFKKYPNHTWRIQSSTERDLGFKFRSQPTTLHQ